jgi:SAM-dependent methyltransferase
MTCPACGGEATTWLTAPGFEPADTARYEIARCASCGSGITQGPEPAPDAYSSGIYTPERPPRLPRLVGLRRKIGVLLPLRALRRSGVRPPAHVLDAGAGTGGLVAALAAKGYEAEGIDTSPRGENVRRASILEYETGNRDAVVLWHTLEHVADPHAVVARVASWLRPGGVVLVAAPNLGSLQARIAGREWFHLDLPRHRTHFTQAGLRACMRGAGIEPGRTWHLVPEHNFHGMWFALLTRLGMTPGFPFHALKRNVPLRARDLALVALAGPLLLPVAVVLELAACAARRGGTIVMAGRT